MVVSKDGKRKRKESPVVDSSPEIPKRTKVQAQRKFAQGQGNPSASYSLSNVIAASSSQPNTPIRENKEPIPELIPHKKPSAEDLVTYICFRGTPGLPPHLDFFNQNNKSADKDDKKDSKSDEAATNDVSNNSKPGSKKGNKSTAEKAEKSEKNGTVEKKNDKKAAETVEKPETIGYAARKRADQVVEGNRKFKNTERLTRLRDRTPKKAETNRRSPRTRSAYKAESEEDEVEENEEDDGEDENDASVVSESKKTPVKKTPVRGRRKTTTPAAKEDEPSVAEKPTESDLDTSTPVSNLRNKHGAKVPPTPERKIIQNEKKATPTPEKISAPTPEKNDKRADSVSKKSDISSKISSKGGKNTPVKRNLKEKAKPQPQSENEEENAEITPPKPKRGRKSAVPDTSKKSQVESSLRSDNNTPECENRSARPMRKTKEAATIYMEWIGLKLNLDDDGSSLDSFPELPNAKETQKIENELKQNSLKAKSQPKPTPTKKKGGKAKGATQPKKNKKETTPKVEEPEIQETKVEVQRSEEVNDKQPSKKSKVDECVVEKDGRYFSDSDDEPLIAQKIEVETKPPPNNKKGKPIKKKGMGTPKAAAKKKNVTSQKKEESAPDEPPKGAKSVIEDVKECLVESQPEVVKDSKLEKSFSDSDDEPLATKLVTKQPEKELKSEPEPLQIITEITPITLPKISPPKDEKLASPIKLAPTQNTLTRLEERSFMKGPTSPKYPVNKPPQPVTLSVHRSEPVTPPGQVIQSIPVMTPPGPFSPLMERFPSPKVNPSFLTPKFDRNLDRKLSMEPITSPKNNLPSPSISRLDFSSSKPASPSGSPANTKKIEPDLISAANLMPSKEESSKIFGIASVSLAQSSGPDNTKCTLGKCGSIHKPVLGPVVPTEAYLGEPLSSKERRKAKVNMTHEQIQRWLIECSSNPDDIQDDLDDDFDEPLKPKTFAPTPPLIREEKDSGSLSSKTGKEVRSESTWSGKGPSLKATPVVVKEDSRERPSSVLATDMSKHDSSFENRASPKPQKIFGAVTKEKTSSPTTTLKKSESISKTTPDNVKSPKPSTSSATSSPKHLKNVKAAPNVSQKKLPMPKRQPVYSTKPVPSDVNKKKVSTNSFSAFSPENETSVYSFDKEDYVPPPVAKPFRRHSRRESNADENTSSEKQTKPEKGSAKEAQQNSISVMLSPEENTKSIKVSLENTDAVAAIAKAEKPNADSSAVGDSDSEGHTFYIPLQGTGATAANAGKTDVIQGVAVKLGREGPEGPNQRVIMHATLVTKAQMGSNTTPIPDSMNVHEIVKNLLSSSKDSSVAATTSKSVPVGTVQPRFKSNAAEPSQNASGSGLTRVNSNSSLLSGSTKSKPAPPAPKKPKDTTPVKMSNNTAFPRRDDPTQMVEAPIFRPTDKEFQDPMEFIERITPIAARFGICKIIPPDSFKPECRVSDDMRFTAYNQYVHKMLHRWGPSAKEFSAIKKYLATQSIAMTHPPWIGGMEVDLPRLYHTVQELGGLKEVIEKKKWARVAEEMCIPKLAQDRVTKLDDIYCKYLLPYDTLSPAERQKLFDEVEADWAKREARARRNADRCVNLENISNEDGESSENDDESDEEVDGVSMECIVKGRSMPLNAFFRIARNTMALWFKNTEPTVADIEAEFWRHVAVRDSHVCVHSGSIDSSGWGYGFPTPGPKTKGSTCARHPWNLKVLTNNAGSVLRSLGPVMGITVPTLHVGMLFSACCWYRDPHGLSWIEYLHTGASKIWYGIPDEQSSKFRKALTSLIPTHCQNKTIWLPCDTAMVPPHMLTDRGVSLCRVEQKPGEYVVVFPRAYTSSIATGYVVSESVYFATSSWLDSAKDDFRDIHESCEPAMFSLEQVLFAISNDQRVSADSITQILPMLSEVYDKEVAARQQLKAAGLTQTERFQQPVAKTKQKMQVVEEHECDLCRANLYISMVRTTEGNIYCLQHALRNINNGNIQAKQCTLIFTFDIEDIESLIKKTKDRLSQSHKKGGGNGSTSKKSK